MVKLTIKQEAFCLEYAASGNATEAYKKAYGAKTDNAAAANAARLIRNDKVQKRLRELAEEVASPKIATLQEIQERLTAVLRREEEESVVVTLSEETSNYVPDDKGIMRKQTIKKEVPQIIGIPAKISDANKAAELLARMQGGFKDELNLNGVLPVMIIGEDDLEG